MWALLIGFIAWAMAIVSTVYAGRSDHTRVPIRGVVEWGKHFNSDVILAKFQVPVRLDFRLGASMVTGPQLGSTRGCEVLVISSRKMGPP